MEISWLFSGLTFVGLVSYGFRIAAVRLQISSLAPGKGATPPRSFPPVSILKPRRITGDLCLGRMVKADMNPLFYVFAPVKDLAVGFVWFIPYVFEYGSCGEATGSSSAGPQGSTRAPRAAGGHGDTGSWT